MATSVKPVSGIQVRAVRLTITPEMARTWLSNQEINRTLAMSVVNQYKKDMERGQWECNGETIKFSGPIGIGLCDGQHRLKACELSGCSFESFVVEYVRSWSEVDICRRRNVADGIRIFAPQLTHCALAVDGALGLLISYAKKSKARFSAGFNTPLTHREKVAFVEDNPILNSAVGQTQEYFVPSTPLRPSVALALVWLGIVANTDMDKLHQFLRGVRDGIGLSIGDPARTYREFIINSAMSKRNLTVREAFRSSLNSIYSHLRGERQMLSRSTGAREFPGAPPEAIALLLGLATEKEE